MSISYKDSGVDIEKGDETVAKIKPLVKSTHNKNVLSNIGLFGGFYELNFQEYNQPVLVASTDGVGTKLKIAFATGIHHTIGQCLVNHCINDILACGAKPLFFLDYFATGKLNPNIAVEVIKGFTIACKENDVALIGGETAEMPSIYSDGEYDVSGTIIGIVEKKKIIDGSKIKKGDLMIGLSSTGLHTNGYSLARAALFPKYNIDQYFEELESTLGEALLKIHKCYYKTIYNLIEKELINGISHITGGGIEGNTKRILHDDLKMKINWAAWNRPPIFEIIQKAGNIEEVEMRKAFNLGIGLILIIDKNNLDVVLYTCKDDNPIVIGEII